MPVLVRYIFICILATLPATTIAAPTVNLQSDKVSYTVGDQVIIVITLSDAPVIYGGGLDLTFNPAVVNANSVQVDTIWDFTIKEGIIDNATGVINDIFFTHFSGLTGDIPVATIVLDTIASGSPAIVVTESPAKQFTDTNGENVVFTINNLAGNILVNNAQDEQAEEDQTDTEQTTNEQAATESTDPTETDQSEIQQTATDNGAYIPTDRSSDNTDQSDAVENIRQQDSDSFITNRQQGDTGADSYSHNDYNNRAGNLRNPSTSRPETGSTYSENADKESSYDPTTQTSLSTDNNPVSSTGNNKADNTPVLLITFVFLIFAFIGYTVFVFRKK